MVLAVATRRYRVPLIWTVLGKVGNSDTMERIALMENVYRSWKSVTKASAHRGAIPYSTRLPRAG